MKAVPLDEAQTQLTAGIAALGLNLGDSARMKLVAYLELLLKWNKVYNLTAVREPLAMVRTHLLDCLAMVPYFASSARVLDVGAGAGLPGLVLAIVYPEKTFELIDIVHKKTAFLTQAKGELGLANVVVHTGRVEQLEAEPFDTITARAVADCADLIDLAAQRLAVDGKFLLMKGQIERAERALPPGWIVRARRPLVVPGLEGERHLVEIAGHN